MVPFLAHPVYYTKIISESDRPTSSPAVLVAMTTVEAMPPKQSAMSLIVFCSSSLNKTLMPAFTVAMSSSRRGDCL